MPTKQNIDISLPKGITIPDVPRAAGHPTDQEKLFIQKTARAIYAKHKDITQKACIEAVSKLLIKNNFCLPDALPVVSTMKKYIEAYLNNQVDVDVSIDEEDIPAGKSPLVMGDNIGEMDYEIDEVYLNKYADNEEFSSAYIEFLHERKMIKSQVSVLLDSLNKANMEGSGKASLIQKKIQDLLDSAKPKGRDYTMPDGTSVTRIAPQDVLLPFGDNIFNELDIKDDWANDEKKYVGDYSLGVEKTKMILGDPNNDNNACVFLWGTTGSGKTQMIKSAVEETGHTFFPINASELTAIDIAGANAVGDESDVEQGVNDTELPSNFVPSLQVAPTLYSEIWRAYENGVPIDGKKPPVVVYIDEVNHVFDPTIMKALQSFIGSPSEGERRKMRGAELPPTKIVGTANPKSEDSEVAEFSDPFANRAAHIGQRIHISQVTRFNTKARKNEADTSSNKDILGDQYSSTIKGLKETKVSPHSGEDPFLKKQQIKYYEQDMDDLLNAFYESNDKSTVFPRDADSFDGRTDPNRVKHSRESGYKEKYHVADMTNDPTLRTWTKGKAAVAGLIQSRMKLDASGKPPTYGEMRAIMTAHVGGPVADEFIKFVKQQKEMPKIKEVMDNPADMTKVSQLTGSQRYYYVNRMRNYAYNLIDDEGKEHSKKSKEVSVMLKHLGEMLKIDVGAKQQCTGIVTDIANHGMSSANPLTYDPKLTESVVDIISDVVETRNEAKREIRKREGK